MRLAKKGIMFLFVLLLAVGTAVPALAAEQVTLSLQVRIGSTTATVNGEKQKIQKPYMQNGAAMVPLGVFQRAFGTTSRLEGENVVRVAYGSRTAAFTIGSKTAWVNGKKKALPAAPVMKNGTLMMPMRPITDMLGASVKFSSGTIVVTLKSDNGIPGQKPAQGDNEEKIPARVGSSFADWSIDYPKDAVAQLGDNEYSAILGDLEGTYMLQIRVWEEDSGMSVPVSDMLEQLEQEARESGETIVDRQTFPNATLPYARLIARDLDGIYWETRRYYEQGRVYTLYLGDSTIQSYREFENRAPLMDSFRTSFSTTGTKTEDLSGVINGRMSVSSSDYGVTMQIPAGWVPTGSESFEYVKEDGSLLSLYVTSAAEGETLADWHNLLQSRTDEVFLPGYAKPIVSEALKAAGQDARIERMTYNLGSGSGDVHWNWLVLKQQNYFYVLRYSAPEGAYSEQEFRRIADSLEIDGEVVSSNFGNLGQILYLKDKSLNVTKSTPKLQISVPAYWTSQTGDLMQLDLRYFLPGGSLRLTVVDAGLEAAAAQAVRHYADLKLDDATLTHEEPKRTEFAGVPAIRIPYTGTNGSAYQAEDLYFRSGSTTYWIHYQLDSGMATEEQLNGIERALQSFKFFK